MTENIGIEMAHQDHHDFDYEALRLEMAEARTPGLGERIPGPGDGGAFCEAIEIAIKRWGSSCDREPDLIEPVWQPLLSEDPEKSWAVMVFWLTKNSWRAVQVGRIGDDDEWISATAEAARHHDIFKEDEIEVLSRAALFETDLQDQLFLEALATPTGRERLKKVGRGGEVGGVRKCLRCERAFLSGGIGNLICNHCVDMVAIRLSEDPAPAPTPEMLTRAQAAKRLNISTGHLAKAALSEPTWDGPPFVRLGRRCLYPADQLQEWIRSQADR